jgi:uncharacterized radical SAM superfamily Fe-S cluster-containing enzyme
MQLQKPRICPICKKQQIDNHHLAKDGKTYICYTCKEEGK